MIALADLFAAGLIGALLRAVYIWEIPFLHFRPWLHAHSHTAMLGWVFIGVVLVMLHDGGRGHIDRRTRWALLGVQAAVIVMLISFPIQSYGPVSITASTVHLLIAYYILHLLWKKCAQWPPHGSRILLRWAIAMFALSTLGIWSIGPIIAAGAQSKEIYYWAIQLFLHFQFNGWFWFAAIAMGVRWAERQGYSIAMDRLTLALWVISAILTYALAIAWSEPLPLVFATITLAVLLQLWAAMRTLRILIRLRSQARAAFPFWGKVLVGVALVAMAMKVIVQTGVAVPEVAVMGFTIRHYVIGFIHLNTLAIMTTLLLTYALLQQWWDISKRAVRAALALLVAGIVLSELIMFLQGTFFWAGLGLIPGHYLQLFLVSIMIPIGVGMLLVTHRRTGK